MPRLPPVCSVTGQPPPDYLLHTLDGNFVDGSGRTLLLRGVNLSGSSKAPVGQQSHVLDGFWDAADGKQSFVGQPVNLDDGTADEHLQRLREWGFNVIRYPVTWEALEHEGPGKYDYEFMDYTIRVLQKCKEYGFKVYMDPHQDIWSRFSGGSGAPYWTLVACGFNPRAFTATQSTFLHCEYPSPDPETHDPSSFPSMLWSTNYGRLAAQTLFTLFFAGRTFAPRCIIDGVNIQDYLQSHHSRAYGTLAERIRDAGGLLDECIIGWDSFNEPSKGLIGWSDLNAYPTAQGAMLKKGTIPSPVQSFRLGMGKAQTLDYFKVTGVGSIRSGTVNVDPRGVCVWADPSDEPEGVHPRWGWRRGPDWKLGICVWAQHGVWDVETGCVLQPEYFRYFPQASEMPDSPPARVEVQFMKDFFLPQMTLYFDTIHKIHPRAIAFVESPVFGLPIAVPDTVLRGRACASPHFYDGLTMITRHWYWYNFDALGVVRGKYNNLMFALRVGEKAIRACIRSQLGALKEDTLLLTDEPSKDGNANSSAAPPRRARYPTIMGELGSPYDLDRRASYDPKKSRYGNYSSQERALDANLSATDGPNMLNYTIWTYNFDSSHAWGDGFNFEDLSIWCKEDLECEPAVATAASTSGAKGPLGGELLRRNPHWRLAFLRDGARAVKAFCRPWPVKTVGVPVDIEFDIKKAMVKIVVDVRVEDMPTVGEGSGEEKRSNDISSPFIGRAMSPLATEIFLPLVHFASDACVSQALELTGRWREQAVSDGGVDAECQPGEGQQDSKPTSGTATPDINTSTATLALKGKDLGVGVFDGSERRINTDAYDITVKVSRGRVELCEDTQMLRWFYPVPLTKVSEGQEWIEVRRTGGEIKYPLAKQAGARGKCNWLAGLWSGESGCTIM